MISNKEIQSQSNNHLSQVVCSGPELPWLSRGVKRDLAAMTITTESVELNVKHTITSADFMLTVTPRYIAKW